MNPHDLDNLVYLLQFTPTQLQDWMKTISKDDQKYAIELLEVAPYEIIDIAVTSMTSFPEAMVAIKPHMLEK